MSGTHQAEKEAVALNSIFASLFMTLGKLIIGLLTGSLGLISEGVHSFIDLLSTIMTYSAVKISHKPADEKHHYGHGKIESITALIETGLLFLTGCWIVYEAINRIFFKEVDVKIEWWSLAIVIASIAIDLWRAAALLRVAKKTKSHALEADALHFSSDAVSSAFVLVGLILVALGWKYGDALASICVAGFVCVAGYRLGKETIETLMDAAPEGLSDEVRDIISKYPSVIAINNIRVRPVGSSYSFALDLDVPRGISSQRVSKLKNEIEQEIKNYHPDAMINIATNAVVLGSETLHDKIAIITNNHKLKAHHIIVQDYNNALNVSMNLELNGKATIEEADKIVRHLKSHIKSEVGDEVEIEVHIEPETNDTLTGEQVSPELLNQISEQLQTSIKRFSFVKDVHSVRARNSEDGIIILFHSHVSGTTDVKTCHDFFDEIEMELKTKWPNIWHVYGYAEPSH